MTTVIASWRRLKNHRCADYRTSGIVNSPACSVLEQALDASFQGIVILDLCEEGELKIAFANRRFERLSGYSREELATQGWAAVQGGEHLGGGALSATLQRGEGFRGIVACTRKDGSTWRSRIRVEPLAGEGTAEYRYWVCQCLSVSDSVLSEFEGDGFGDSDVSRSRERFGRDSCSSSR